jgi:hypothetical protein
MPDGEVQMHAESRDHEDRDGEHEQHHDCAGVLGWEVLCSMPQAPDDERQAQDQQHIGEDRADERGLDDADQARP